MQFEKDPPFLIARAEYWLTTFHLGVYQGCRNKNGSRFHVCVKAENSVNDLIRVLMILFNHIKISVICSAWSNLTQN